MKANSLFLRLALLLAAVSTGLCQPVITTQPSSLTNIAGTTATFSVGATGTEPLHYQWQFNQLDLPGKTGTSLILANAQLTNAGEYAIVVTNVAGATSQVATLTVDPAFTKITTGPIVTDLDHSPGGTWGDFNNDGFLDLFVPNGMDGGAYVPFLYRNNGDGTFTKVTSDPPVNFVAEATCACWG